MQAGLLESQHRCPLPVPGTRDEGFKSKGIKGAISSIVRLEKKKKKKRKKK